MGDLLCPYAYFNGKPYHNRFLQPGQGLMSVQTQNTCCNISLGKKVLELGGGGGLGGYA